MREIPFKALAAMAIATLPISTTAHGVNSGTHHFECGAKQSNINQAIADAAPYISRASRARTTIHTEGTARYATERLSSVWAKSDWAGMRLLATAWRLTNRPEYLAKIDELLLSWTSTYEISLNPIDESDMEALIDAYAETAPHLPLETREQTRNFLLSIGRGYAARMQEMEGQRGNWVNNWQSHRVKLLTMAAFTTGDDALIASARRHYTTHTQRNISDSGAPIDFTERDSVAYAIHSIHPMLKAALIAQEHGEDWFSPTGLGGGRLRHSIAWLDDYSLGARTHREFINSRIRSDATRNQHKMGAEWRPGAAAYTYWLASHLDPQYRAVARRLGGAPSWMTHCGD